MRERGHLIALALFFAVGVATLDDYGVIPDAVDQWNLVGRGNFEYILGDEDAVIDDVGRFYGALWSARINFEAGVERHMRIASEMSARRPSSESGYNVYPDGDILVYVKDPCEERDTAGRFFLSATPADAGDLSDDSRERGLTHNALNFDFDRYGVLSEGRCVIIRTLPDYPISRLETGQWLPGEGGRLWSGETAVSE